MTTFTSQTQLKAATDLLTDQTAIDANELSGRAGKAQ